MENQDQRLEQNKQEEPVSILSRSLLTGFIGGLLGGFFGVVLYYFNFSEVAPKSYLLRSWLTASWIDGWLGTVLSILMIGVISLLTAFIYFILFKKVNSLWMGVAYGIVLWFVVFYIIQPIFPNIPPLGDLNANTIVSTICLYILYGTFIGYSISYDYTDTLYKLRAEKERGTE
ncbi:MAG TPA: YqhR family membrane protein [Lentibacillus sp.]|uniref:YqhR family membrane protein n=1 Tax=Lentibacillus sp. TaxID=1925746 RepID=UPI002B4AF155|nr:YqhR family membrane protein [Lentibacillus sp.]HLR62430.1 YqhR family membrane protein [Lentibacillus sp.]